MKTAVLVALLALAAACSTVTGSRPDLATSEVVPLAHQPADQIAARVCSILHGVEPGDVERRGCSVKDHAGQHDGGGAHVSLIADPRSNSIVLTAPPGREVELARAVALVKELDMPATGS